MTAFHEVSLPLPFSLAASGGPERRVDVVALGSGQEARNAPWAHGRRRYDIGGGVRTLDELHELIAFFEARRGKLYGFRFRDPFDHKSCAPSRAPAPGDQTLSADPANARLFALTKRYGDSASSYQRPIRKPLAGSVRVAVAGVELAGAGFSVDATAGLVTLAAAPSAGAAVTAGFVFDTPVRFDMERLDLGVEGFGAGRALSVSLLEILA